MFGFDKDEDGSRQRFYERVRLFQKAKSFLPRVQYGFWWVVHNCIAHFFIGLLPLKPFFWFHDYTSRLMHPKGKQITTIFEDRRTSHEQAGAGTE